MALSQFDSEFNVNNTGRAAGLETLPDGEHTLTVTSCALDVVTQRDGTEVDVIRWIYRTSSGQAVENTTWLRDTYACNLLGADLAVLGGFNVDKWGVQNGMPFSKALPLALNQLPGVCMLVKKTSYEKAGRTYHNMRIKSRVAAAAPPMPTQQGSLDLSPNDQLPF